MSSKLNSLGLVKQSVDQWLNQVNYGDDLTYKPSAFALAFVNFIKLVNGGSGEENTTPVLHLKMLDQIDRLDTPKIANMVFRGAAKALALDEQVITMQGNIAIKDLKVGDTIFDRNGKPTVITHKSEVFNKPMYGITLVDGRSIRVSEDHLNIVLKKTSNGVFKEYVHTTKEILDKGVHYNRRVSYRNPTGKEAKWFIPTQSAIELEAKDIPLDAYTVGVILGDGSIDKSSGFTRIHCHVNDLPHYRQYIPYELSSIKADKRNPDTYRFSILGIGKAVKSFIGTENTYLKRVPQKLLWGSIEQRLAVLRGLMDTDGTVGQKKSSTSFCSVSEGLANDVLWLVRSLGGEAFISKSFNDIPYYRVHIRMGVCPFSLPRKVVLWQPNLKGKTAIKSIEKIDDCPSQCIAVSSETHSFITTNQVVTHNTTLLGEYLLLYLAVFGELPTFGKINLAIYVSDSVENGVKNMRKNLEYRRENSSFLMKAIPHAKFTDIRWEFNNASGKRFIVKGYGGQALSLDTRLYTADGYTTMGACKTGDYIYGPDGKLAKITAKSEVFYKPMYSLNLADGRNLKVSHDHINSVMVNTTPNGYATWEDKNLTTAELLSMPLTHTKGNSTKHLVKVKNIEALQYPNKDLPLDPYTLGLILGDGSIKKNASGIVVTADEDDCAYYRKMIPYTLGDNYADTRRPNVKTFSVKGLNQVFRDLRLDVHGKDKFIPEGYFTASVEQRLALLQGLLDTDGSISDNGRITFTGVSEKLIDDVSRLVYSLGGKTHKAKPRTNLYKLEVWVGINPFKLPRKAAKYISGRQHWNNTNVISITRIADEPSQCIAIDNEDHQYVAGNYVRTHNTGVRGVKEMGVRPQLAILDDLVSDEDARSQTCIDKIKDTVHNAIDHAMHPMGSKTIWSGTPFNASDPLYEAIESGSWAVNCYPVCEKFPCTEEEFRGAWENRFTYEHVRRKYEEAKNLGRLKGFNQELMLRIMSDEDRLVAEADINWYSRNDLLKNKSSYNYYITTDFATSEKQSADYSVISVWAVNYLNQFFYVDGICKRQTMDKNVEDLFGLCSKYKPLGVGIEVSGQQEGFIPWLKKEQVRRQIYFNFASSNNSNKPGIRPSVDKLQRFYVVAPWFNAGNMFFPEELQTTPTLIEAMDELRLASSNGLKSKHDDFLDTISMLGCMHIIVPSQSQELSYNSDSNIWTASAMESSSESALKNYIV